MSPNLESYFSGIGADLNDIRTDGLMHEFLYFVNTYYPEVHVTMSKILSEKKEPEVPMLLKRYVNPS